MPANGNQRLAALTNKEETIVTGFIARNIIFFFIGKWSGASEKYKKPAATLL
jgi:hypothetical protein